MCKRKDLALVLQWLMFLITLQKSDAQFAGYDVSSGIPRAEVVKFDGIVKSVIRAIASGWTETALFPQLAVEFLISSHPFPSRSSFERFIGGDKFFDPRKVLQYIEWVPKVANSDRASFEKEMRKEYPNFNIFLFSENGTGASTFTLQPNASSEYHPITYVSPVGDEGIIGFDLYNDPFEGPYIRRIQETGRYASTPPFKLRGAHISKMGMTVYMPIFHSMQISNTLTADWSPNYFGCVVSVILFEPMMASVLDGLGLENVDVFLFAIETLSNGENRSTFVGLFQSGSSNLGTDALDQSMLSSIRPENITGDLLTLFEGPYSYTSDVRIVDQNFRVLVRARKNTIQRDVLVFSSVSTAAYHHCTKMVQCSMAEQGQPLVLTVEDSLMREITVKSFGANNASLCKPRFSLRCNITLMQLDEGLQIFEVFADGEQILSSPLVFLVTARQCSQAVAAMLYCMYIKKEDKDHALLVAQMARLRARFGLTRRSGFILSSEWYPSLSLWAKGKDAIVVQTKYLEAAANLALFKDDFEPRLLDSLCVCLGDEPQRLEKLRDWILEVCQHLLDPTDCQGADAAATAEVCDKGAQRWYSGRTLSSRDASVHPMSDEFREVSKSPEDRFTYFRNKVARLRIWQEDDRAHFKALKDLAQRLMDKASNHYDERYQSFCVEPDGIVLASMPFDIVPTSQVLKCVVAAIRVDDHSRKEAEMQARTFPRRPSLQNEDLFISQLSMRAKLLDDIFWQTVQKVIRGHKAPLEPWQAPPAAREHRRVSVKSMECVDSQGVEITNCQFKECVACVELHSAPVKTVARMREKLLEYSIHESAWPLSANILDPVRVSIVCNGPSQVLQVLHWFEGSEKENGLPVCRVKNKFSLNYGDVQKGYRDLKVFVLLTDASGLSIIGEIQIHDRAFYDNKHRTHRLYKIMRAQGLDKL